MTNLFVDEFGLESGVVQWLFVASLGVDKVLVWFGGDGHNVLHCVKRDEVLCCLHAHQRLFLPLGYGRSFTLLISVGEFVLCKKKETSCNL